MNDTDLLIRVERQTETQLVRRWITILADDNSEMFMRRSVILGDVGGNLITLSWQQGKSARAKCAAMFETATSPEVLGSALIDGGSIFINMQTGDTTTLHWWL